MTNAVQIAPTRAAPNAVAGRKSAPDDNDGNDFAAALDAPAKDEPQAEKTGVTGNDDATDDAAQARNTAEDPAALFARLFALTQPRRQEASTAGEIAASVSDKAGLKAIVDDADPDDAQEASEAGAEAGKKKKTEDMAAGAAAPSLMLVGAAMEMKNGKAAKDGASEASNRGAGGLTALFAKAGKTGETGARQEAGAKPADGAAVAPTQDSGETAEALLKTAARTGEAGPSAKDGGTRTSDSENPLAGVKVVSVHTAPAPSAPFAHLAAPTATALANSIHAGLETQAARAPAAVPDQPSTPATLQTLKIQLQPESLGTVTAQLHLAGDALRVELRVDSVEARHRLNSDSDAIVKSLRALGYDVDHVTIQTVSAPAPATATNGQNATAGGRDQSFQQPAGSQSNGQGSSHAGNGRGNGEQASRHPMERADQGVSAGGGLFI